MLEKIPVIIDCDPGLDDAVALFMAGANEKIDIKAVTVVAGNQTLDKVGNNALRILGFGGIDVPVAFGFEEPIVRELNIASEVHGEDGLYGVKIPESTLKPSNLHAIDLIAKILRESNEKITLIPMGPLTNIAMFLKIYPELKDKIERISLMGGAINGGNRTSAAEFNIFVDPEAADIVFKSGIPITMCGLDVTQKAIVFKDDIERIKSISNPVAKLVGGILENLSKYHKEDGIEGCYLHDPVAVSCVANPTIIKTIPLKVDIELQGKYTTGATVGNFNKRFNYNPNADVAFDIGREAFVKEIIELMKRY